MPCAVLCCMLWHCRSTDPAVYVQDLVVESASGSYVVSHKGEAYLDAASGIGVTSTGHCHPRVVAAVTAQTASALFAQQNCTPYHQALNDVVAGLDRVLPPNLDKYLFVSSGSEAVDNAVKIARHATRRPNVIVFDGAFHGRTIGVRLYQPLPLPQIQ